jgi:serine phosphatase RsbU (regulator of sigma subunit)
MSGCVALAAHALDIDCERRSPGDPNRAGGDVVCVDATPDGSALIALVDLAAKGDAAVRQAEAVRKAFRIAVARGYGARLTMSLVNAALGTYGDTYRTWLTFGTALVLTCSAGGEVAYAAAGVEPAMIFRSSGAHEHFVVTGPLVGLDRDWIGGEVQARLEHGDTIVAYTDGITQSRSARNPNAAVLGTSGVVSLLRRSAADGAPRSCRALMDAIEATWNRGHFLDDATLLVLGRRRCV